MRFAGSVTVEGGVQELNLVPEAQEPTNVRIGRLWLTSDGVLKICSNIVEETPVWKTLDNVDFADLSSAGSSLETTDLFQLQRGSSLLKTTLEILLSQVRRASPIVELTNASETLGLNHLDSWLKCNRATEQQITIPPQSSVAWPDFVQIEGHQAGVGSVTIVGGSGVTIVKSSKISNVVDGQNAPFGLKRLGTDEWLLFGQMVAA